MISEREQVDAKLRRGLVHRHNPLFQVAFDDVRRPHNAHVDRQLKRYDRNLFLRYNCVSGYWELWRWKGLVVPRSRSCVPPDELVRRAVFVFKVCTPDGVYLEPDMVLVRRIAEADRWARAQYTPEQLANAMDSEDAVMDRRKAAARSEFVSDWARDNKNQIRSLAGNQTIYSTPR